MATLSITPTELFLVISRYLSVDDLRNLYLVSRSIYKKIEAIFFERIFRRQKYYTTAVDSKALLDFSRHPRGLNIYLKHLVIDLFVPYYEIEIPLDEIRSLPIQTQITTWKVQEICRREKETYQFDISEKRLQNYHETLCAAISNFPNLEVIDFVRTSASDMTLRSLRIHFPKQLFGPDIFPVFRDRFLNSGLENHFLDLGNAYVEVMKSVAEEYLHKLREINICSDGLQLIDSLGGTTFQNFLQDIPKYCRALRSLRKLEIRLQSPLHTDCRNSPLRVTRAAEDITRFIAEIVPQLDTLVYKSRDIPVVQGQRNEDITAEYKKYALYVPSICLSEPTLYFPNIKILHFEYQSFIQPELSEFLTSHKQTLRDLTLKQCLFQTASQQWSSVFQLLQSELSLTRFFFDGLKQYNRHRCIPWLQIHGSIRSGCYQCELVPGATGNLDFGTAMYLIQDAEPRLEVARVSSEKDEWEKIYTPWRIDAREERIEPLNGSMEHKIFTYEEKFRDLQAYITNLYSIN
ncbi:hypothetical protein TWF506_001034 [Arthrobotrys conoides]|uniref:F-box domain-containing protein n=1 Tax=Arthrobotrys conoides TaxID=74498 RepID=A0AAN8NSG5_9PEZI